MTDPTELAAAAERHRQRMQRKKAYIDGKIAEAQRETGVLLVNTGNGKGKSSAAFGLIARALGHGFKVGVVQFIKGSFSTGEEAFFRRFPDEVDYCVMGQGFTWETQDKTRDIEACAAAWQQSLRFLQNPEIQLVVLDELNIALKQRYLPLEPVLDALQQRPEFQHVVVTGRSAAPELIEIADTVTDMTLIKHGFHAGIKAQKGMEL